MITRREYKTANVIVVQLEGFICEDRNVEVGPSKIFVWSCSSAMLV